MLKRSRLSFLFASLGIVALAMTLSYTALADRDRDDAVRIEARLSGFNEVPPRLTTGRGFFKGKISHDGNTITFTENWAGLVGNTVPSGHVLFSHIHFGQPGVAAGVVVFLCGPTGATNPEMPACEDSSSGTATGTITATDVFPTGAVSAATDQGIKQGDLAGLIKIIRSGNAYVNIHTTEFGAGEIRGQIQLSRDDDDFDHDRDHDR